MGNKRQRLAKKLHVTTSGNYFDFVPLFQHASTFIVIIGFLIFVLGDPEWGSASLQANVKLHLLFQSL